MLKLRFLLFILIIFDTLSVAAQKSSNYEAYYQRIIQAEILITSEKYAEALSTMDSVFEDYNYVFLRDYKVAAQLALYIGNQQKAFHYLARGIADGLSLTDIKNNRFLQSLQHKSEWNSLLKRYDTLRHAYINKLDHQLKNEVHEMFIQDQKLAQINLRINDEKSQDTFLLQQFAPQSERHMRRLRRILAQKGYPGEKLIGNQLWAWTILSHHNSISPKYNRNDTLYKALRPLLLKAIQSGELSPYDFAVIEEWRITVTSEHKDKSYGYLNTLTQKDVARSDQLRRDIGMRSIETTNKLVDIQQKTGMNFYLEGSMWIKGKIPIHPH
ncbi:hypothetical protein SAMN04488128_104183 [Chitinophaga eiseniae]|uniref:Uncharacterized protein n=1 Tax=Chitinophaga eiseniae TaxID=634771 RepID=A0A1T4T988_9BACT|nr:hypothetical protein [Chitinophaga eiseniae]SKA36871.1 hypothetical protein SAMN04488128_104183 [Chitinophaga eiseniae]